MRKTVSVGAGNTGKYTLGIRVGAGAGRGLDGHKLALLISRQKKNRQTVNVSERVADTSTGSICWINFYSAGQQVVQ